MLDVLLGKVTDKVTQNRHDELSVFGIGSELGAPAWRSVIRQLIVQGYLKADQRRYGALVLTESSRALLKGEVRLALREDAKLVVKRKKVRASGAAALSAAGESLFDALRQRRREIADEHNLPAYVIFHDATLAEMAEHRPMTADELLRINGVGAAKLARYGAAFLEVIRAAADAERRPMSAWHQKRVQ